MKILFAFCVFVAVAFQAAAQTTNAEIVVTTNYATSVDWYRDVNGKLYNTQRSVLFSDKSGKCLNVSSNQLLVETFTTETIQQAVVERHQTYAMGSPTGRYHDETKMVDVGTKETPGPRIVLRNYPLNLNPAVGQKLYFRAMQIGTTNYEGQTLELLDYGTQHKVAVITTNYTTVTKSKIVDGKK